MIHITKAGFKRFEWNGDLRMDVEEEFESIRCLRQGVTLVEAGVTLGDIIAFTYRDDILRGFMGFYSGCRVSAFYNELQLGVDPPDGEVKYVTAAMRVEVMESAKHDVSKTIDVGLDLYGRGDGEERWALDLSTMREIGGLPFRLENNATIERYLEDGFVRQEGLEYCPSLLEVLDAIFYDISFHGSPAHRDEQKEEIMRRAQEVMDGTAKLVPFELDDEETIQ
jgi:hypothetical protein